MCNILERNNIFIIDLVKLFQDKIDIPLVNDLHKFTILGKVDKTFKRLFLHNIIFYTCTEIIGTKCREKIILFFNEKEFLNQKMCIFENYNKHLLAYEFCNVFKTIKGKIPIRFYNSEISLSEFKELLREKNGKSIDILNKLKQLSNAKCSYSFLKAKSFCNKHGLQFLVKEYFERLKTKQLFIS